jgi:hypothetical protein
MSPPGRLRPRAEGLWQATDSAQGLSVSGLSRKGEFRSARHAGTPLSAHGSAKALVPERAAHRAVQ